MSAFHRLGRGGRGREGGKGEGGKEGQIFEEIGIVRGSEGKIRGDYNKRFDRGWEPRKRKGGEKRREEEAEEMRGSRRNE